MNLKAKTCCFTGHRSLNHKEKLKVAVRLREIIAEQIKAGVVFYGAGGALGFDTLAAQTVLEWITPGGRDFTSSMSRMTIKLYCRRGSNEYPKKY